MAEKKWMEIITVRLSDPSREQQVKDLFSEISTELNNGLGAMQIAELYVNTKNETDWSIYLHWDRSAEERPSSVLGMSIAEALSHYGLVNHTFWEKPDRLYPVG